MEIMTAEQAAEAAKGLTFEKVWAALMESRQQMEESHQRMEESRLQMDKRMEESRQQMEESRLQMDKRMEESRKRMEESRLQMDKRMEESRQQMEESHKRMEESHKRMEKSLGGLGNTLGLFTEDMFLAEMADKFDALGFNFDTQANRKKFYNGRGRRCLAEIDSVLENGEYVMLAEIKTKLTMERIEEHLERIAMIRKYMDARGDSRKLVGTVAGGVVPESVLNYAHSKGLYVLVQSGDAVAVADMPEDFKAQVW